MLRLRNIVKIETGRFFLVCTNKTPVFSSRYGINTQSDDEYFTVVLECDKDGRPLSWEDLTRVDYDNDADAIAGHNKLVEVLTNDPNI